MGFTRDDSVAALKKHSGNVDQAIESLLDQSSKQTSDPPPTQTRGYDPPTRGYDPPARGYSGRGRQGEFGLQRQDKFGITDPGIESLLDQSSKQTSDPPLQTRGYDPPTRGYDPQARGYSGRGRQGEFGLQGQGKVATLWDYRPSFRITIGPKQTLDPRQ